MYFPIRNGLGRQDGPIGFDPRDLRYGYAPYLEFRFDSYDFQFGLEHFCFHSIDRENGLTPFWNKIFFNMDSKNYRISKYRSFIVALKDPSMMERLSFRTSIAYFIYEKNGIFNVSSAGGEHDLRAEFYTEMRYALYNNEDFIMNIHLFGRSALSRKNTFYESLKIGLENHITVGTNGFILFCDYYPVDRFPILPKDRLLEFGIKIHN